MRHESTPHTVVNLRSADVELEQHAQRLCALAGLELRTLPPGSEAPAGSVVLDDATDPANHRQPLTDAHAVAVATTATAGALVLPADAEELLDELGALHSPGLGRVIGVAGVRGGLGTTALAARLARASHDAGLITALVDLDPAGGGVELLLGIEHDPGPRWADLLDEHGAFAPQRLRHALPTWHGVRVLGGDARGGVSPACPVARLAVAALARACAVVILDLPRSSLAPAGLRPLVEPGTEVVLLVGTDLRSAAAAQAAVAVLEEQSITPRLVGRVGRSPTLDAQAVAEGAGLPLLATLRNERGFDSAVAHGVCPAGQPRGPLATAARRLTRALGISARGAAA